MHHRFENLPSRGLHHWWGRQHHRLWSEDESSRSEFYVQTWHDLTNWSHLSEVQEQNMVFMSPAPQRFLSGGAVEGVQNHHPSLPWLLLEHFSFKPNYEPNHCPREAAGKSVEGHLWVWSIIQGAHGKSYLTTLRARRGERELMFAQKYANSVTFAKWFPRKLACSTMGDRTPYQEPFARCYNSPIFSMRRMLRARTHGQKGTQICDPLANKCP